MFRAESALNFAAEDALSSTRSSGRRYTSHLYVHGIAEARTGKGEPASSAADPETGIPNCLPKAIGCVTIYIERDAYHLHPVEISR
jgi:hypothetical protein